MREVINDWRIRKELFFLTPMLESDPVRRVMLVSREIYEAVTDLGEGIDERMGRLREHLEVFVRGDIITSDESVPSAERVYGPLGTARRRNMGDPRSLQSEHPRFRVIRRT